MAKKITTNEEAKEAAEALKKLYGFSTKKRPSWFNGVSIGMQQDGSYDISICIPSWGSVTQEEQDDIPGDIKGVKVGLRVVTPSAFQLKKQAEAEEKKEEKKEEVKPDVDEKGQ